MDKHEKIDWYTRIFLDKKGASGSFKTRNS